MTLKKFLLGSLILGGSYQLYRRRHKLLSQWATAQETLSASQTSLTDLKRHLHTLMAEKEKLSELTTDLTYQCRVFSAETQAHLTEIRHVLAATKKQTKPNGGHQ